MALVFLLGALPLLPAFFLSLSLSLSIYQSLSLSSIYQSLHLPLILILSAAIPLLRPLPLPLPLRLPPRARPPIRAALVSPAAWLITNPARHHGTSPSIPLAPIAAPRAAAAALLSNRIGVQAASSAGTEGAARNSIS